MSIDSIGKLAALVGLTIYAALFISYDRYYGEFNLAPEDVGVSYLFILSGLFGLLLAVVGLVLYLSIR